MGEMEHIYIRLFMDGDQWCALYGDEQFPECPSGFGETQSAALRALVEDMVIEGVLTD